MVFFVILVITSPFWLDWLLYHGRMINPENCPVSKDATIIDVTVNPVGNSKTRRLKTVVFFSDGTQYVTHKSRDNMGLTRLHMTVDEEVLAEIFNDAVTAHDKLCSGTRSQPAYSVIPPAEPKAPAPSVESGHKFVDSKPKIIEPSPTIADPASPAPATPKLRYCKLCGAPIDPVTRKCTDCRKQYFRLPHLNKKHLFIGVGTLVAVVVVILMTCLVLRLSTAEAKVEELNAQVETLNAELANQKNLVEKYTKAASSYSSSLGSLQTKYDDLYKENIDLRTQNTSMSSKISFYDWAVVIVPDDGSKKYHKYGCSYLDMSDGFYAYNPENARYFGYKPCSHCCD